VPGTAQTLVRARTWPYFRRWTLARLDPRLMPRRASWKARQGTLIRIHARSRPRHAAGHMTTGGTLGQLRPASDAPRRITGPGPGALTRSPRSGLAHLFEADLAGAGPRTRPWEFGQNAPRRGRACPATARGRKLRRGPEARPRRGRGAGPRRLRAHGSRPARLGVRLQSGSITSTTRASSGHARRRRRRAQESPFP
jgi:hypothetical protein